MKQNIFCHFAINCLNYNKILIDKNVYMSIIKSIKQLDLAILSYAISNIKRNCIALFNSQQFHFI